MTVQDAFRENLMRKQKELNISNNELSRRTDKRISAPHIGQLRTTTDSIGSRTPNLYTAYIIAKALGCTVNDMLEGCDE